MCALNVLLVENRLRQCLQRREPGVVECSSILIKRGNGLTDLAVDLASTCFLSWRFSRGAAGSTELAPVTASIKKSVSTLVLNLKQPVTAVKTLKPEGRVVQSVVPSQN